VILSIKPVKTGSNKAVKCIFETHAVLNVFYDCAAIFGLRRPCAALDYAGNTLETE